MMAIEFWITVKVVCILNLLDAISFKRMGQTIFSTFKPVSTKKVLKKRTKKIPIPENS